MNNLKNLKKAVGDYQRTNKGGTYDPRYGFLMFDRKTRELWTDEYYDIGHNTWKEYNSDSIMNLGRLMGEQGLDITMKSVVEFIKKNNL